MSTVKDDVGNSTDWPILEQEIIRADWRTLPRGAKIRDLSVLDLMVDIDEVICPTIDTIHALAHEAGLHDNSRPMQTWAGYEQYQCPPEVYWDLWSNFALSGGYVNTEPIPGAVEALREAYFEGHRIHLVTARGFMNHASDIRKWTPEWVADFAIPWHTLVYTRDKVGAQRDLGIRFDYSFDDSPKNTTKLREDRVMAYLVDHPHNEGFEYDLRVPNLAAGIEIALKEAS
jgi:hypothetical protein